MLQTWSVLCDVPACPNFSLSAVYKFPSLSGSSRCSVWQFGHVERGQGMVVIFVRDSGMFRSTRSGGHSTVVSSLLAY